MIVSAYSAKNQERGRRTIIDPYLLAALLLSSFFRLYHLGGQSIWLDEAFSIKFAKLELLQIFFLNENTPPLYYTVLHWWIQLFGTSEFSVRLPSAIFGILSIFIMYKIGSLLFDVKVGRLSALLLSISVFHIHYSQEARAYSLSVLLTLLSMYLFLTIIENKSRTFVIGYVMSSVLLLYSHIYGMFIIIAQNIYFVVLYLISNNDKLCTYKKWLSIQCLIIALFVPWINIFVIQIQQVQKDFWITMPSIYTVFESFCTYSSESITLLLVFIALSIFSAIFFDKRLGNLKWKSFFESLKSYQWEIGLLNTDKVCFLLVWLVTPIILPFIISHFSQPIYLTKYTIVASASLFLMVAGGVSNARNRYVKSFIIITITALSLMPLWRYYTEINKEQWRDAAQYVDTHFRMGDVLIIDAPYCVVPFNYYSHSEVIRNTYVSKGPHDNTFVDRLCNSVIHYDRVWLILSHTGFSNSAYSKEQILEALTKSFDLSVMKEYYRVKLYLFDRRAMPTRAQSH